MRSLGGEKMKQRTDEALWEVSNAKLAELDQIALTQLLDQQGEGPLMPDDTRRLQALLDEYGRLLVRKAHAGLLLARRGYRVPSQQDQG